MKATYSVEMNNTYSLWQDDRVVNAKILQGDYGYFWVLHPDEHLLIEARGKEFLPFNQANGRGRILNGLGLHERIGNQVAPSAPLTKPNAPVAGGLPTDLPTKECRISKRKRRLRVA